MQTQNTTNFTNRRNTLISVALRHALLICTLPLCIYSGNSDIRIVLFDLDQVLVDQYKPLFRPAYSYPIKEGVDICREIHEHTHVNLILLSNSCKRHGKRLQKDPRIKPILQKFHHQFYLAKGAVKKPHPYVYTYIVERFQVLPEQCLLIDDQEVNVKSAEAFGMHTIQFDTNNMHEIRQQLRTLGLISDITCQDASQTKNR